MPRFYLRNLVFQYTANCRVMELTKLQNTAHETHTQDETRQATELPTHFSTAIADIAPSRKNGRGYATTIALFT